LKSCLFARFWRDRVDFACRLPASVPPVQRYRLLSHYQKSGE